MVGLYQDHNQLIQGPTTMAKTYLIAYGENPNDRLTAVAFRSRRQATTAVITDLPATRHLVTNEVEVDEALPGKQLLEVYNGLTGDALNRFPRRIDGARRLFAALPRVAEELPPPVPTGRSRGGRRRMTSTQEESATSSRRRFADPSQARGKGISVKPENRVELLVNENPKRGGAAVRFARYTNGMTVADAVERGITKGDIRWDVAHGFVRLVSAQ